MVHPALRGKNLTGTKEKLHIYSTRGFPLVISGLLLKLNIASGPDGNPRISDLIMPAAFDDP